LSMAEHEDVYRNETETYHALVSREDYLHNLDVTIKRLIPSDSSILESGAGTGRVTKILAPLASELTAFDISVPMVSRAYTISEMDGSHFLGYGSADHRHLPVGSARFDWIVSGWSVCYLVSWQRKNWIPEVIIALQEFLRVLKPDGRILIIETLGTGKTAPEPPPHLIDYLQFLDNVGFNRQWIRTDYLFDNAKSARSLTEFFFGSEMLQFIESGTLLPECTGLWIGQKETIKKNLFD